MVSSTTCRANSMPSTIHSPGDLNNDISYYLGLSIAASTKQTYSSAEKRFLEFCLLYRPPFGKFMPVDENTLVQYAAYLARSIKYSSIKSYLAAVRHLHILNGYDLDFKKYPRLQLICKGIKRAQGCSTRVRLPITIHHLKLFFCLLAIPHTSNCDSLMLWAAMTLAFFGFMRLGELTCNSKFSLETHLSPSDVHFLPSFSQPDYISVQVKISKTDPFRIGHTLLIGKTNQPICPVKAMKMYLVHRTNTPGPLFQFQSGSPLTKDALTSETRSLLAMSGVNPMHYAGHSYRIGAATTAASVGLPPWLIKTLGRWTDCYERYIRCPDSLLSEVSTKLVQDTVN